ncbi:HK97-gp10 family putative phage morphogenesis protein [Streptococcus parauberis]|uniref:HK97-gp10 family putative phage morphogenesis protein n=1 Tax=Streptococcus parauberis TaxID=1348 RepID=UPI0037A164AB
MADIEWHGLEQMELALGKAAERHKDEIEASLKNHTEQLKAKAQSNALVDTGFMKGQIETSYGNMEGTVHAGASYSGYVEYGTRFNKENGHKPFMRPAFEVEAKAFEQDVKKIMKGLF